jgi:hypothetical protein
MIMLSHVASKEEAMRLPKEINGPINWTHSFGISLQELEATNGRKGGYKVINYVGGPIQWSYKAVRDGLTNLKQTGSIGMDPAVWTPISKEIQETAGLNEALAIERKTTEKD